MDEVCEVEPGAGFRQAQASLAQGPVRTREYEKDGIRNRVFELRAETIGKLDRTERQGPATGAADYDARLHAGV